MYCSLIKFLLEAYLFLILLGVFSFLSYSDPNLLKTLDVYDGTGDFLRKLQIDDDTLTKAIIGTIGDVDAYQLPDAKGYSRYVYEIVDAFEACFLWIFGSFATP